jgi:hypothetical protein
VGDKWLDSGAGVVENRNVMVTDYFKMGYAMNALPKKIAFLPKGAWILDVLANVTEIFNGSGTDLLTVGITSGGEELLASVSCAPAAMIIGSQIGSALVPYARLTADTYIYAEYNDQNGDASTGIAEIAIVWAPGFEQGI